MVTKGQGGVKHYAALRGLRRGTGTDVVLVLIDMKGVTCCTLH